MAHSIYFYLKRGGGDWKILKTELLGRKPENKFTVEHKFI